MLTNICAQRADIAIGDLTITHERQQAVDFTMPFMNLGISILFKKPDKTDPSLFSFLSPLSIEVWLYTVTSLLGITMLLYTLARFTPYQWENPHPCDPNPEELENSYDLKNTFWFTVTCLMQAGGDPWPKAISTRIVASMWWFFTLIMVSSYTANLAAFLTAQRMGTSIESVEALAKQTKIQYGCLLSGSTRAFFKGTNYPTYQKMYTFMETSRPNVYTETNLKGVERVKKGNYAFLMESTSIDYLVQRDCDLQKVGDPLDSKGYGIATPKGKT
ncbi:hypothetical protein LAZ67_11001869 [Cordylochernes scorpioides]|uniref:Ionotropic glutamate receptor C-terminal domain-containing protein n=1 Tax=Cordylochernes scorpioides TaxID=51811 RepID=A0ABY6L258_9ARAC|nr:hypothetical protein LAZ67_11001869 [Cordylochernes scorpioides]